MAESVAIVKTTIKIPSSALMHYERLGAAKGATLETIFSDKLATYVGYDSEKPLYLSDSQRQRLEKILSRNNLSGDVLIAELEKLFEARVDNVKVALYPQLLRRLKTRCFVANFEQWLSKVITEQLEHFVGLR